jgi:hypothetical protein
MITELLRFRAAGQNPHALIEGALNEKIGKHALVGIRCVVKAFSKNGRRFEINPTFGRVGGRFAFCLSPISTKAADQPISRYLSRLGPFPRATAWLALPASILRP